MSPACPGRCNSDLTIETATPGEPVWCEPCARIVRSALRALPLAYTALWSVALLTASQPADALRVSGSRERPSPAPWADLRDEIFQTTRAWEDDLRTSLRHRAARDGRTREETLAGAVRYLNRNFEPMMKRTECAKDFGHETNVLFSSALRMVKNGPLRARLTIPCPYCNRRSLMQQEGLAGQAWYTACEDRLGGCGKLFTETEMTWIVEVRTATAR